MAISANTVWEFKAGGSMNNGGGFTSGGTDYSQNPTPVLALTDCYHGPNSTTLTSDSGGFTAAMVGNLIKVVSGTNFTVSWFEIKTFTNANNVVVDRSLGVTANVTKDGVVNVGGALAYGIAAQDTAFHAVLIPGNTVWYSGGNTNPGTTYTLAGNIAAGTNGSAAAPIVLKGYKNTRGDVCTGTYRPTIACGAYTNKSGTFNNRHNLNFTGTASTVFAPGGSNMVVNCKAINTTTVVDQSAFESGTSAQPTYIGCEASCLNGSAFVANQGTVSWFIGCYAHDARIGFSDGPLGGGVYISCVADTCSGPSGPSGSGFDVYTYSKVINCTTRNCKMGIGGDNDGGCAFVNNIVADNFVGASWVTAVPSNVWMFNCFYGNTTPRTNVTAGNTDIATDPMLKGTVGKGTDGASVTGSKVFTSVTAPFAGVTTSDCLAIFAGTGLGIKLGVYAIASVDSNGQLTLTTDPTTAVDISGCTFGVMKGNDFTLELESSCIDAALDAKTYSGVTV